MGEGAVSPWEMGKRDARRMRFGPCKDGVDEAAFLDGRSKRRAWTRRAAFSAQRVQLYDSSAVSPWEGGARV